MNLYEIKAEIYQLLEQVDPDTGELSDDIADKIIQLNSDFETVAENLALYVKNITAEVAAIKNEETELAKRRKVKENNMDRLMDYLADAMISSGHKKFETARVKINARTSQAVNIIDFDILPNCFKRTKTTVTPDKIAIANELKTGSRVDGAEFVTNQSVTIK